MRLMPLACFSTDSLSMIAVLISKIRQSDANVFVPSAFCLLLLGCLNHPPAYAGGTAFCLLPSAARLLGCLNHPPAYAGGTDNAFCLLPSAARLLGCLNHPPAYAGGTDNAFCLLPSAFCFLESNYCVGTTFDVHCVHKSNVLRLAGHYQRMGAFARTEKPHAAHQRAVSHTGRCED